MVSSAKQGKKKVNSCAAYHGDAILSKEKAASLKKLHQTRHIVVTAVVVVAVVVARITRNCGEGPRSVAEDRIADAHSATYGREVRGVAKAKQQPQPRPEWGYSDLRRMIYSSQYVRASNAIKYARSCGVQEQIIKWRSKRTTTA